MALLFRTLSIQAFTIKKGQLHLEKNQNSDNWSYFLTRIQTVSVENQHEKKEEKIETTPTTVSRDEMSFTLNIKKAGLDGLVMTYDNTSYFGIPLTLELTDTQFLATGIYLATNKPFNLKSKINASVKASRYLELSGLVSLNGKMKLLEDNTFNIKPSGEIHLKLTDAKVKSEDMKTFFTNFVKAAIRSGTRSGS